VVITGSSNCTVSLALTDRKALGYKLLAAHGSRWKEKNDGATFSGPVG
jgi:hypothetical protein